MDTRGKGSALILGAFLCAGLVALGYQISHSVIEYRQFERSVTVKGLSEQEYPADIVIWPIQFTVADNSLESLYESIESNTALISDFLEERGIAETDISISAAAITDKSAQQYGGNATPTFRFTAVQTVTVYSSNIQLVRGVMGQLTELGKKGIVLNQNNYQANVEYIFTRLNEVKPKMIEEATTKAREVAQKFAKDSKSVLGKIKRASQGQFSISARDRNNPHIKKLRVVSTVEYYLSD
ncbi:SIMPL domain-containing protein [Paraglaciecola sp. 20A4]|uniref:SIMPL domain-containing protein n=1 Tax=Paraglaciecola sp. 20A4 TaxID=2687288 RepID=UPI00140C0B40|nr:SIMPL domain-containing protein [Paraglaciecola sp. 20A4]